MAIAPQNVCIPYFEEAERVSGQVTGGTVTGKTFVKISGDLAEGPGLNTSANGGTFQITTASAAGVKLGVAAEDGAVGAIIDVITGPGLIVPVTAGGSIAANAEVEIGSGGKAVTIASGKAVGLCLSAATNNNDAIIKLY